MSKADHRKLRAFRHSQRMSRPFAPDRKACLALLTLAGILGGCGGGTNSVPTTGSTNVSIAPVINCETLQGQQLADVTVTSATRVAAASGLPSYCMVLGTQNGTQHDVKALLPDAWQNRYYQQGGGGFDGTIPNLLPSTDTGSNDGTAALKSGAIVLGNNGGDRDPTGAVLLNNPLVVQLYANAAIGVARDFGDALAQTYYGKTPKYAYYEGCSNGGRGALNAASKYGTKFDAVIAGAPTRNLPGQVSMWTRAATTTLPSPDKLKAVNAAAIAKCDKLDGVADGIISNWQACTFDPTTDVPASVGLTAAEAASVKSLMTDLALGDGTTIYSGYGFGDMSAWGPIYAALGVGHMRNIVLNDPSWDPSTFVVNTYYPKIVSVLQDTYHFDAETNGLVQFLQAGKKIMVWQGSDDALLSQKDTIRTWQEVVSSAGATASSNSRLYIASGVNHCKGGPGADNFDLFTPTMNWVEQGAAPAPIVARKLDSSGSSTVFTRPLCVYPAFPKYKGTGDANDAANFTCSTS